MITSVKQFKHPQCPPLRHAPLCVKVCQKMRSGEQFDLFWQLVERTREELGVIEPALHRARKHPRRYEDGGAEPSTIDSPKVYYRRTYYQCVDAWTIEHGLAT